MLAQSSLGHSRDVNRRPKITPLSKIPRLNIAVHARSPPNNEEAISCCLIMRADSKSVFINPTASRESFLSLVIPNTPNARSVNAREVRKARNYERFLDTRLQVNLKKQLQRYLLRKKWPPFSEAQIMQDWIRVASPCRQQQHATCISI
ncbi:hypothetical protein HN011_008491, partial [Eciton burchellii]